ncbi:hypothetical protein P7K49_029738 [Saguinus oedipus]|uniref:Uncharacterized protein n=1 Tax=Saguinus oedipus TaxID=9490 RepID=A0ABQ9U816_SAGOE|nr:hypothetical protein P7K49_029738 [Saguinus oedipus]
MCKWVVRHALLRLEGPVLQYVVMAGPGVTHLPPDVASPRPRCDSCHDATNIWSHVSHVHIPLVRGTLPQVPESPGGLPRLDT